MFCLLNNGKKESSVKLGCSSFKSFYTRTLFVCWNLSKNFNYYGWQSIAITCYAPRTDSLFIDANRLHPSLGRKVCVGPIDWEVIYRKQAHSASERIFRQADRSGWAWHVVSWRKKEKIYKPLKQKLGISFFSNLAQNRRCDKRYKHI